MMESAMMQVASRMLRAAQNRWHRLGRDESGSMLVFLSMLINKRGRSSGWW